MSEEFSASTEGLHFLEIVVIDDVKELYVLARPGMVVAPFPNRINFDNHTWSLFTTTDGMSQEEAESFAGKAGYRIEVGEPVHATEPVVLEPPEKQYFLVGTTWSDTGDMLPTFLKRHYWQNGYERTDAGYNAIFDQVRVGDRIAAKRLNGQGAKDMRILALGIVTDIDADGFTLYVKWVIQLKDRNVPVKGIMGTIHGPYLYSDPWVRSVFSI
jgi:hypothetical protein